MFRFLGFFFPLEELLLATLELLTPIVLSNNAPPIPIAFSDEISWSELLVDVVISFVDWDNINSY